MAAAGRRGVYRHCSGAAAECGDDVLREGEWETVEDCGTDATCVLVGGEASCNVCSEGCDAGHCGEDACATGPCCLSGYFAPSTTPCGEEGETTECRCTSGACGADLECRSAQWYCTGLSAECTDENPQWTDWALETECGDDQVCDSTPPSSGCVDCPQGCADGQCVFDAPDADVPLDADVPPDAEVVAGQVSSVTAGGWHTCAVLEGGDLRCWGLGLEGRLGYGNTNTIGDDELPSTVEPVAVGGPATQVAAGQFHTCAVLTSGNLRCWGGAESGQLGYGNTNDIGDDELPSNVGVVPCQ